MYPATVSTRDSQIIKPGIEIDDVAIQRTMSFAWTHELAHFFTVPRSPTNLNYGECAPGYESCSIADARPIASGTTNCFL